MWVSQHNVRLLASLNHINDFEIIGIVYDRVGVSKMLFFGGILTSGGYMVMSFGSNVCIFFLFLSLSYLSHDKQSQ